jgi:hypothetical protein
MAAHALLYYCQSSLVFAALVGLIEFMPGRITGGLLVVSGCVLILPVVRILVGCPPRLMRTDATVTVGFNRGGNWAGSWPQGAHPLDSMRV